MFEAQGFGEFEVVHHAGHQDFAHVEHEDAFVGDERPTRRVDAGTPEEGDEIFTGEEGIEDEQEAAVGNHPRSYRRQCEENGEDENCYP